VQGRGHVGDLVAFEVLVHDLRAVGAARAQSWLRSDAVDLPFDLTGQISGPVTAKTSNFTLEEPALTIRIGSMVRHAAGSGAPVRRACA
jgi:hypothetical protein